MKLKTIALHASLALLAMGLGEIAQASGYNFGTQSARNMGMANAGAAEAADATTIYYNPAGLTNVDGTQVSVDLAVVSPKSEFSYTTATNGLGGPVSPADNGGDFVDTHIVPHGYLSKQINDKYTVGLGVFVPFGSSTEFDENFVGRYYTRSTDLKSVNLNPSIGIKLNDQHSVGFGLSAQYMDASLEKNYLTAQYAAALCLANPGCAPGVGAVIAAYSGVKDTTVKVTGDDWGFGFNLGYQFRPNEQTRIGVAYRSKVKHTLNGKADFTVQTGAIPGINAGLQALFADADATVEVTTPESLSINGYHKLNDQWAIMGDVTWTGHSRLQEIRVNTPVAIKPDRNTTLSTKWKDTYKVSIGASYKLDDKWTLRGGYMYDESPVPDSAHALTTLPDADRQWLSFGASYNFDKNNSIDVAYSYVWLKKAQFNRTDDNYIASDGTPGTLVGEFKTHSNLFSLQYNHKF